MKKEVETTLVHRAKGMFRWVICQLDVLRNCTTVRDVKRALNMLPPTLDETYERILLNIDREVWQKARTALQWLIFSARPLRLQDIAEAVVIDPGSDSFLPEDRMFEPHDIVGIYRSLISISDDTSEVRLAHYSVQEYLVSERIRYRPASFFAVIGVSAEVLIAEVCLTYILLFDKPDSLSEDSLSEWPLLDYASRHWFYHARRLANKSDCDMATQLAETLLTSQENFAFINWLRVFEPDMSRISFDLSKSPTALASPLYYSSYCGLLDVVKSLLRNGADIAVRGGKYTTALNTAAYTDSRDVAFLLVGRKAEVNVIHDSGASPLHHARVHDNAELVRLLLKAGVDIEERDVAGGTAMHIVCFFGHMSTLKVLLEHKADVNSSAPYTREDVEPGSNLEV